MTSTCVSRGRRGAISHPPSFCMAGVALMALGGALGLVLVARDAAALLRSRRGAISHPPSFCVAGVALMALLVTSTCVSRDIDWVASRLLMKECRLSELEPRASRNCHPNDVEAHPCRRHQRWPQGRGHCLCPLLQRNLHLNSVARRRRDSRPREKKCFCNYDTCLSVHIMKFLDAMCEEQFDAVAKVVVCVSEYDETNGLTQCVKNHFWPGKKHFFSSCPTHG